MQAAQATVEGRPVHSVHCYFLRRGDFNAPIVYEVEHSRDGGSFTARRVVAIQHGRPIFTMSASFQATEAGLDWGRRIDMPPLPSKPGRTARHSSQSDNGPRHKIAMPTSDFTLCRVEQAHKTDPQSLQWWIKTRDALPEEQDIQRAVLAYISDFGLLGASLLPHEYPVEDPNAPRPKILFASIDHAIWFHRPCKVDEWLLYYCRSISTSGARGTAQGSLYDAEGMLVATTMQEGLVRQLA
ncbi:MAG: acyl-CoA thioesterase [Pseudomonadales bacterium]